MMIERLFKPLRIGKSLLSLLAMFVLLLAPQGAWAEDDYGLTVAGVAVTSANASAITGQNITGTVSYTKKTSTTPATLTLEGATLTGNVVSTVDEDLIVNFIGSNRIDVSVESPYVFVGHGSTASSSLTFLASGDFQLIVNNIDHESYIATGWKSSPVISHSIYEDEYAYEKDWYADCTSYYVKFYQNKKYDVWYNDIQFCDLKLQPETGVTFVPGSSKVELSTFSGSSATIKSALSALTVSVSGENTLSSIRYESTASPAGTLTITKDEQSSASLNKLTLSNNTGAIYGFSEVSISTPMVLKTPVSEPESWNAEKDVVISDEPIDYNISVAGTHVTSANCLNVLGDAGTPSVSFTPAEGETPATLKLNGATIGTSIVFKTIDTSLSNLTINLTGNNTLNGSINYTGNSSDASVTFTGTGSLVINNSNGKINGYTPAYGNALALKTTEGSWTITPLEGPTIAPEFSDEGLYCSLSSDFSGALISYSLIYATEELTSKNKTDEAYTEAFLLEGPATVTGKVTLGGKNATTTGKHFAFEKSSVNVVKDETTSIPTVYPAYAADGFVLKIDELIDNAPISINNNMITGLNIGTTTISATLENENIENLGYELLNVTDGGCILDELTVNVLPAAPTISSTATVEGDAITITAADGLTNPIIYYSWDEEQSGTLYTQTPPTAKNGTLYAWVIAEDATGATYTSPKAKREFRVKNNIANAYVEMTSHSDYFETYTGSAITPTFVVKESDDDNVPTIESTNYDVTYKYKSGADDDYSDATEIKNAGYYLIVITGKGETYGGSKNIEFQVGKATITEYTQWVSPSANNLNYTGEKQNLVTAGTVPEGVTIKYYVAESAEANPYGETVEWSTGIPKGTAIGTYYIFCKADESNNYEAWPAEGEKVCLTATIGKGIATLTLTTTNQTSVYTGSPIEFNKNNITITPSTISKDGIGFHYYEPNSENPDQPIKLNEAPTQVGTYNVEIYLEDENYSLGGGEYTATLTITAKDLSDATVTLNSENFTYNGSAQTPETVTVVVGETQLTGDDYDISYQKVDGQTTTDGVSPTDAGTYYVKVTGKGNYSGAATKSFTIAPASIAGYTVTVDATQTYTYTGSAITPSVTVTIPNVGALDAANYTVSYENNVNAADENATIKPTVTVTGKDNYTGTASATFTIDKATIQGIEVSIPDELTYNGTKQDLISVTLPENVVGAKVKYYYQSVLEQDYNGSFDLNCAAMYTFTETVPAETNAGYFLMLYKVEGGDNYKDIAPAATQRNDIAPATVTKVTLNPTSLTYTGSDQTVSITSVKAGSLTLGASDYTVKLDNETVTTIKAKNTGTYTVEVTGQGNFTGSETATFTIMNKTLDVAQNDFHNHWMTYYSDNGDIDIPANSNIGAYVATGVTGNAVTVTQISYIPEKVAVLLNNETTETPDNTNVTNNMLRHADEDVVVPEGSVIYYGLYNGKMKRVHGTISAGKNYLLIPIQSAPELTIVVDGQTTGISEIETMRNVDNENVYDLMGRKVQKPSKNGLYISKGHKVVINK